MSLMLGSKPVSYTHLDVYKRQYYYKQQIQEYKDQLNNPEKLQQKAMSILRELPAFQTFMRKNSFLSSIFLTENPTDINDPSLAGLQRRTVVEAQIQN